MELKELKELIGFTSNRYQLVGAMTGKLLYQKVIQSKSHTAFFIPRLLVQKNI